MIQAYMEETEDMLLKAEECIIRLEMEFSSEDINELFRIAHTIKGSSQMAGYEAIGNLMHRMEDLLDLVRNSSIPFNQDIVSLCFESIDIVKKMLQTWAESNAEEVLNEHMEEAARVENKIQSLITVNRENKKAYINTQEKTGIVSALLNKEHRGKNKYYITVVIEEDAPMISPVFVLILKSVENIGTLLYSSVQDDYLSGVDNDGVRVFEIILCTNIEEAELYTHFSLFYVEKINIINLNRNINEINDYCLSDTDYSPYLTISQAILELYRMAFCNCGEVKTDKEAGVDIKQLQRETADALSMIRNKDKSKAYNKEFNKLFNLSKKLINLKSENKQMVRTIVQERIRDFVEKLYFEAKGKYIVKYVRLNKDNAVNGLKNFMELVNKSTTLIILIDLSMLDILHENEIKEFHKIISDMKKQGIETGMITYGSEARRIINIFDSIKQVYDFRVFSSELEAILGIIQSSDSFQRIMDRINQLKFDTKRC